MGKVRSMKLIVALSDDDVQDRYEHVLVSVIKCSNETCELGSFESTFHSIRLSSSHRKNSIIHLANLGKIWFVSRQA